MIPLFLLPRSSHRIFIHLILRRVYANWGIIGIMKITRFFRRSFEDLSKGLMNVRRRKAIEVSPLERTDVPRNVQTFFNVTRIRNLDG